MLELWLAVVTGLILFLYGIDNFSREIQRASGERFRDMLGKLTKTPVRGAAVGALLTAIIQSSSATTIIAVGLVNSGTISFAQSLGIIIGANVGTTITGQLVALKVTSYASVFMVVGFIVSLVSKRYKIIGRALFYFGLLFLGLNMVSSEIKPLKDDPGVVDFFSKLTGLPVTIAAGALFTAIVQSSSVTTGVVVLLAEGGLFTLMQGFPILLGANIGTTATSLLASANMSLHSRRAAVAHLIFNIGGILLFLPFMGYAVSFIQSMGGTSAQQIANAHTLFNVAAALVFLTFTSRLRQLVERLVPGDEEEILFEPKYLGEALPEGNSEAFELIEKELRYNLEVTAELYNESYSMLKSGDTSIIRRTDKLELLNDYLDEKIEAALVELSGRPLTDHEVERAALLVWLSNELEQVADTGKYLGEGTRDIHESGAKLSPEAYKGMREIYRRYRANMRIISKGFPQITRQNSKAMHEGGSELRKLITQEYKKHLKRMRDKQDKTGIVFVEYTATMENAVNKVRQLRKICELYTRHMEKK